LRFHEVSCRWLTTILDAFAMDAVGDPWDQVEQHAVQSGFRPSLAELADWSGKSLSSLDRACRQRHGCSPGQRLRQVRLAYAQALASQGGLARPAVARLAGYADRRSLRRALQRD
jgi:transcriptional regulator GlxA family with amidase domain